MCLPQKNWVKVVFTHKISCLPKNFFIQKNNLSYVLGISIYTQNILGKTCFTQIWIGLSGVLPRALPNFICSVVLPIHSYPSYEHQYLYQRFTLFCSSNHESPITHWKPWFCSGVRPDRSPNTLQNPSPARTRPIPKGPSPIDKMSLQVFAPAFPFLAVQAEMVNRVVFCVEATC